MGDHKACDMTIRDLRAANRKLDSVLSEARKAVENHAEAITRLHDANLTMEALLMALASIGSRLGLDKSASPKVIMGAFEEYCKNADRLREERDRKVTRIETLKEERDAAREWAEKEEGYGGQLRDEREALKAEVERWKAAYHEQIEREPK